MNQMKFAEFDGLIIDGLTASSIKESKLSFNYGVMGYGWWPQSIQLINLLKFLHKLMKRQRKQVISSWIKLN